MPLIVVDCEAYGGSPVTGELTEFGAVSMKMDTFHGIIIPKVPVDPKNPAIPDRTRVTMNFEQIRKAEIDVFKEFNEWLGSICGKERPVFVSDNVAFDWQWINCGFHRVLGDNPFGHSGRRISDFYAGLTKNWSNTQRWKGKRITKHDHNPVHDAMGNVEALRQIFNEMKDEKY